MTWDDYERCRGGGVFSERKSRDVLSQLQQSREALERGDASHFLEGLPPADRARVLPRFRDQIGYLDIETTGLTSADEITTIALYDGQSVQTYVADRDLDDFPDDASAFGLLVTYNGERFDLPFLRAAFERPFSQPHLDLCPVLRAFGGRGGLKECEHLLGIDRHLPAEIDGRDAIGLWRQYQEDRDDDALSLLLAYNAQDVLSLELLLVAAYNLLIRYFPLSLDRVPVPQQPSIWGRA